MIIFIYTQKNNLSHKKIPSEVFSERDFSMSVIIIYWQQDTLLPQSHYPDLKISLQMILYLPA